jgi:hypothetical protein
MGEVYRDAGEFAASSFDFAGTDAHADVEVELAGRVADRCAAADCPRWSMKGGANAVTGELLVVAREAFELSAHCLVVSIEQVAPRSITDGCDTVVRADDVGEQQRRQHPIRVNRGAGTGDEPLDLVRDSVLCRAAVQDVQVCSRHLEELRVREVVGEVAALSPAGTADCAPIIR